MDDQFVACICEGNAEEAILKILLEEDKLSFSENEIINLNDLQLRNAKKFAERYLTRRFPKPVRIYRILDSHREKFALPKLYAKKAQIENIVTAPEIEILIIIDQGKYEDFQKHKSNMKPSTYCKQKLKIGYKKSYKYIYEYFSSRPDALIAAMQSYKRLSKSNDGEMTLADLLKCESF